jgi:hypothetical protein
MLAARRDLGPAPASAPGLVGGGLYAGRPHADRRWRAHDVYQAERRDADTGRAVGPVAGVGQRELARDAGVDGELELRQGDPRLAPEIQAVGDMR